MTADGQPIDEVTVTKLLRLHGAYVDGRIRESLAAAEAARLEAERTQPVAEAAEDAV
jgi:hypothetical protein